MSKENFLFFAKNHPELANHVLKKNISWQQLYEMYEIYGENNKVWDNYLRNDIDLNSFKEVFNAIKKIDLDSLQNGINNIQKTIGMLQDIGFSNKTKNVPEPIYKRFQ